MFGSIAGGGNVSGLPLTVQSEAVGLRRSRTPEGEIPMTRPRILKVQDHEGDGRCQACGREGLRWIATLTDGTTVGLECAKKATGLTPPTANQVAWTAHFTPIAQHNDGADAFALWQHVTGQQTRETRNGHLTAVGGARQTWEARGWL